MTETWGGSLSKKMPFSCNVGWIEQHQSSRSFERLNVNNLSYLVRQTSKYPETVVSCYLACHLTGQCIRLSCQLTSLARAANQICAIILTLTLGIKAKLEMAQQSHAALERRIEEINAALLQKSGMIEKYDDIRTRELVSSIKVPDKRRLLIRLKDGTEIM